MLIHHRRAKLSAVTKDEMGEDVTTVLAEHVPVTLDPLNSTVIDAYGTNGVPALWFKLHGGRVGRDLLEDYSRLYFEMEDNPDQVFEVQKPVEDYYARGRWHHWEVPAVIYGFPLP